MLYPEPQTYNDYQEMHAYCHQYSKTCKHSCLLNAAKLPNSTPQLFSLTHTNVKVILRVLAD